MRIGNLGFADDKAARADVLGRDLFHLVGKNERRRSQFVVRKLRHQDAARPRTDTVPVDVLHHQIDAIASGTQRDGLPVERGMLQRLLQQILRHVDLHRVLEGLRYASGNSGDPAEYVHRAALDAVFRCKRDVLVLDLERYRHQHRIASDLYESVRTSKGIRFTLILWLTTSSRSLNLTGGGAWIFAISSILENSLLFSISCEGPALAPKGHCAMRSARVDRPICS